MVLLRPGATLEPRGKSQGTTAVAPPPASSGGMIARTSPVRPDRPADPSETTSQPALVADWIPVAGPADPRRPAAPFTDHPETTGSRATERTSLRRYTGTRSSPERCTTFRGGSIPA